MAADKMPTNKILNNSYNQKDNTQVLVGGIKIDPGVSDRYEESVTEDPVLMVERKETQKELYEIFLNSPFSEKYPIDSIKKIEKKDLTKLFYYIKDQFALVRQLSAMELVIAFCEFFELSYKIVYDQVLSTPLKGEILNDLYENHGMKKRMQVTKRLF